MKSNLIKKAEEILGISIERTSNGRLYYYAEEDSDNYSLTQEDLMVALKYEGVPDAYSLWCADTSTVTYEKYLNA